ncbi:sodium-dependent nutrient amino acid transporter 1-like isoform X2 [Drosophila miranda]|uniref:sodium-dependent nutrient amino acid transporter 1-like isoform X2 n=1 Tax=Drosophila miranda TaxID=7229 RepID=UPI00143FA6D9|nr:sodium-dependent nutrient amino acid transporter 1-like isoform X2 [Drosophila miranda]
MIPSCFRDEITAPVRHEPDKRSATVISRSRQLKAHSSRKTNLKMEVTKATKPTEQWDNGLEFLFSCISLSVGLGNIWRFPYIAFQNGGGTFVIPYLIALLVIGRPVYYLEIALGQFTDRGVVKAFDMAPLLKGVAVGQVLATGASITYYSSIMALTLRFLVASLGSELPWSRCREKWGSDCHDGSIVNATGKMSPAQLYFEREILHEVPNIDNGLGMPNLDLVGCLAMSWLIIEAVLIRGIKSSGKSAYFLGVFPYVVLLVLLFRAVTLPGAMDGIIYFFKPQWRQLLDLLVWYAAVTQVFFSLAICFGTVITYASYNNFNRNVYKDIVIITTMDSCSSIIAGCITFGILGNLAKETGITDIGSVVKGGAGLAFISYPEAIARFEYVPQMFAVLFFLMLFVLGIGSTVGMGTCILRVVRDHFGPRTTPTWALASCLTVVGFGVSIVYMTPGGQFILNLVDFYVVSFTALILAIGELVAVAWVYGVHRFCADIKFMMGIETGWYWRLCWLFITPGLMAAVLVYMLLDMSPLTYKGVAYPALAHVFGWFLAALGLVQLPGCACYALYRQRHRPGSFLQKLRAACEPTDTWGPAKAQMDVSC